MAPVDDPAAVRATAEQASKGYEYAFWRCHVCRAAYPDITFMRTVFDDDKIGHGYAVDLGARTATYLPPEKPVPV